MKTIKQTWNKTKNIFKRINYKAVFDFTLQLTLFTLLLTNIFCLMYKSSIYFDIIKYSVSAFWLMLTAYLVDKSHK